LAVRDGGLRAGIAQAQHRNRANQQRQAKANQQRANREGALGWPRGAP